jgi:hypothetical protein
VTILAALVVALSVMYFGSEQREVEAKVIAPEYLALKDLKSRQLDLLASRGTYSVEVNGQQVQRQRIPVADAIAMMSKNPALAVPAPAAKPAPAPSAPATSAPAAAKP